MVGHQGKSEYGVLTKTPQGHHHGQGEQVQLGGRSQGHDFWHLQIGKVSQDERHKSDTRMGIDVHTNDGFGPRGALLTVIADRR